MTSANVFLRGTLILSAAVLISKLLGLIYLIPLKHIIGYEGINLLLMGYIPYTVILSLATMGIPLAVSKYVAKHNSLGNYRSGKKLLRSSFYLLLVTGTIATVIVYFLAPYIVRFLGEPEALGPIRAVSVALLIVPAMAVLRGYFQGWQSMGPTGVSQVIEQLVRVLFILFLSLFLLQLGYSLEVTVTIASLGAFCGALAGMVVLLYYWFKRRHAIHQKVLSSSNQKNEPIIHMYSELLRYAIPISFVSLAIPLFQLIDWAFFKPMLHLLGYSTEATKEWFAILAGTAHKVMMIPVSLATAFALAIIPAVTQSYARQEENTLKEKINQGISILMYFMIPASVGLFILAEPLYYSIYGDLVGVSMLLWYAPAAVALALYTFTAATLQGIHETKWSAIWLLIALLVKGISTPLFIFFFLENGAILATTIGFTIGALGNLWIINSKCSWDIKETSRAVRKMISPAIVMGASVYLSQWVLIKIGFNLTYIHFFLRLLLGTGIGLVVYILLTRKMPWIEPIVGRYIKR
jgi:O-antigen/teichoic acid export membrane protein